MQVPVARDTVKNPEVTYLTTEELSARIKYDVRTIRDRLKDSVLLEGRHYIRPFNGRKILFIWEVIQSDMTRFAQLNNSAPKI
ncbi:MAG: hypothetical protein KKC58_03285 [Gammaproteobacteria bacterium]|nr:hypothetical protein [Gammaproteobacteria bacterium]